MATTLPAEQDKLLKEFNDIDAQERQGILPERSNINLYLIVLVWILGTIFTVASLVRQAGNYLTPIILICSLMSVTLIAAFYNKKVGFFLSCIAAVAINGYVTWLSPQHHSEFVTLLDGLTIFIFANQFGTRGYYFASALIAAKVISIFFLLPYDKYIEHLFSNVLNIVTVGVIPVLMGSVSRASRRAKKQELRAEILSLQNQDLLSSWQSFYQGGQPASNQMTQTPAPSQAPAPTAPVAK